MKNLSLFALILNLVVIVWGAMVRATHSGAGCGDDWPLCEGQLIPVFDKGAVWVEYTHRLSSGLAFLVVVALLICSWRYRSKFKMLFYASLASFVFILFEALIGAAIVLFGLVEDNSSVDRAILISFHLVNTLFLIGSLTWVMCWSRNLPNTWRFRGDRWKQERGALLKVSALFFAVAATGALSALGDTLYPSESLIAGLKSDFSSSSPLLIRLRVFHPLLVVVLLISVIQFYFKKKEESAEGNRAIRMFKVFVLMLLGQMGVGVLNILTGVSLFGQMVHLLLANLSWMSFCAASLFLVFQKEKAALGLKL